MSKIVCKHCGAHVVDKKVGQEADQVKYTFACGRIAGFNPVLEQPQFESAPCGRRSPNGKAVKVKTSCPRCNQGFIMQFAHIANGVCFSCGGRGWTWAWKRVKAKEAA